MNINSFRQLSNKNMIKKNITHEEKLMFQNMLENQMWEDLIDWHLTFTPWCKEETILQYIEIYKSQIRDNLTQKL